MEIEEKIELKMIEEKNDALYWNNSLNNLNLETN